MSCYVEGLELEKLITLDTLLMVDYKWNVLKSIGYQINKVRKNNFLKTYQKTFHVYIDCFYKTLFYFNVVYNKTP